MTLKEAAALLNGRQYREEDTHEIRQALKEAGFVAAYGASDDLIEFVGAINDEAGAGEDTIIYITRKGLPQSDCSEGWDCPYFVKSLAGVATIKTLWGMNGFDWSYETAIPHEKFIILEDEETYCEGIVFSLVDLPG